MSFQRISIKSEVFFLLAYSYFEHLGSFHRHLWSQQQSSGYQLIPLGWHFRCFGLDGVFFRKLKVGNHWKHKLKVWIYLCIVAQSCLTLWDPMGCSPPVFSVHEDSPGKNTGVGCCAHPRDLPNPGIEPRSSALQADSLPSEPPGNLKCTTSEGKGGEMILMGAKSYSNAVRWQEQVTVWNPV